MSELIAVRLSDEVLKAMDEAIEMLGGNRSDFIRRSIEMRLEWSQRLRVGPLPVENQ